MSKLQGIGDSVQAKRLIIPGSVQISGRCDAVVQRVRSALNGGTLSRIERMVTGLTALRELARLGSLHLETTQIAAFIAENTVKLYKDLFLQIPFVSPRDENSLFERMSVAAGIKASLLHGVNVFVPGPAQKLELVQLFWYHGAIVVFYENVGHVFTLGKNTFKHHKSFGASGGSTMDQATHEFLLNAVFGALWYIQNVGAVSGVPECTKPIDNCGTCTGMYDPNHEPTDNWRRVHYRRAHYKMVRGVRTRIEGFVAGGNPSANTTIKDPMRKVRPKGSVADENGGV